MACAGCERRRAAMHALMDKAAAHARRLAGIRKGVIDAKPATDVRAKPAKDTQARATDSGQAGDAATRDGNKDVEGNPGARPAKGRPPVRKVRAAGSGEGSAR